MIAYTGIETISNLSEEARDPPRDIPRSIRLVSIAVFAIYFTLPSIALSALPVHKVNGEYQTLLGLPPEEGGYRERPGARARQEPQPARRRRARARALRRRARGDDSARGDQRRRDRRLADHLRDGDLPAAARGLPAAAQTLPDALARARRLRRDRLDRGHPARPDELPGDDVRLRRDALVHDRPRGDRGAPGQGTGRGARLPRAAEPQARRDRLAAIRDPRRHRHRGRVARRRRPGAGDALVGLGWLAVGFVVYVLYRRRSARCRCARPSARRRSCSGSEVEYRTIVVPVLRTAESEEALVAAARLAAERRARIVIAARARGAARPAARRVDLPERKERRRRDPRRGAGAAGDVRRASRSRAGSSAPAAPGRRSSRRRRAANAELVILGAPRTKVKRRAPIFGRTVDYVLQERADARGSSSPASRPREPLQWSRESSL